MELSLPPNKVKKLLVTAGVLKYECGEGKSL